MIESALKLTAPKLPLVGGCNGSGTEVRYSAETRDIRTGRVLPGSVTTRHSNASSVRRSGVGSPPQPAIRLSMTSARSSAEAAIGQSTAERPASVTGRKRPVCRDSTACKAEARFGFPPIHPTLFIANELLQTVPKYGRYAHSSVRRSSNTFPRVKFCTE